MSVGLIPCGTCGTGTDQDYKLRLVHGYYEVAQMPHNFVDYPNPQSTGYGTYGSWGFNGIGAPNGDATGWGSFNVVSGLPEIYLKFESSLPCADCPAGASSELTNKWDPSVRTDTGGTGSYPAGGFPWELRCFATYGVFSPCAGFPIESVLSDAVDLIETDFNSQTLPTSFTSSNRKLRSVNTSGTFSSSSDTTPQAGAETEITGFGSFWIEDFNSFSIRSVRPFKVYFRRIEIELNYDSYVYVSKLRFPGGVDISGLGDTSSTAVEETWDVQRADPSDYSTYYADTTSQNFPVGTRLIFDMPEVGEFYILYVTTEATSGCP